MTGPVETGIRSAGGMHMLAGCWRTRTEVSSDPQIRFIMNTVDFDIFAQRVEAAVRAQ